MLTVSNIQKSFGTEQVLRGCGLEVPAHHTLSILGRSGSGKTSLLKIIAGLETADAGTVVMDGEVLDRVPAYRRNIVYLYQEALLFPHLTVAENIAFGLRIRKLDRAEIDRRVREMLVSLDLLEHAGKSPEQLSGGQRQRVAFGRALVINPRVLLLDEPFGALDVETRREMQAFFKRIAQKFRITSIFVTHDLKEALIMGDRLGVMDRGVLRHYPNREAFIADKATGVGREIEFWQSLDEPAG
ncbi:MAG: ABC transporter ATP-binding protein [Saprospiraceae bacterium]